MYHHKKTGGLLILIIMCFAVACKQQSPTPVASSGEKIPNAAYPTTLADMKDWHGIKVMRSQSNGRMNCSISFLPSFGMMEEERNLLIYMVSQNAVVRSQTDCWISPDDVYQALNQLLRLVVEKQNSAAANLLLYSGTAETPFNLDGEVAEGYTEDYLIPVLEKYEKLDTALDQARESVIAKNICADLQWRKDIKDTKFKYRIKMLIEQLNAKRMGRLARRIQTCK